ncbi:MULTISPECIES: ATP-binding protein [Streptomyces]|uniref:ATP-binding protein n=1 Tax=Streptomyces doudnae TaxID=3075536 RepID=A0ABD5ESV9_9ACTN|nr:MULTISPECIES: ATP-binding protein [unclassified Streptomyces]MDT0437292.1 ATP-binding protein [Streptomyces sp. DSM 41981]MYQ64638.1 ATP-binding protein [Streptomyces sp. SID4950]SCD83098.1 Anti-sigma regulatory factor (Ser/Thr protein kinase) [Streptomyces sp. SolWspMP-5a-2]
MSPHTTTSSSLLDTHGPDRAHWFELPARRDSVRAARHGVDERVTSWRLPRELCADAVLLVSELVTNVVLHTISGRILCGVRLMTGRCLRVEVHDYDYRHDCANVPRPQGRPGPEVETGRGLFIVEELADSWGVERSVLTTGNVVWATLGTCA